MTNEQAQERITQIKIETFDAVCKILKMSSTELKVLGFLTPIEALHYKLDPVIKLIETLLDLIDIQTLKKELRG